MSLLRVRTRHSDYLLDMEQKRFSRQTRHEDANSIPGFSSGEWRPFSDVHEIAIGASLFLTLPGDMWLRSTPVEAVEEVEAAA